MEVLTFVACCDSTGGCLVPVGEVWRSYPGCIFNCFGAHPDYMGICGGFVERSL